MLQQRFALVTGCGTGSIGEALTKAYLKQDFEVFATVVPGQATDDLTALPKLHVVKLDVTDEDSIQALRTLVDKVTGGRLDVLANNAGVFYRLPAVDQDRNDTARLIHINLLGPMRIAAVFHRLLVRARGVITFTCSINGISPAAFCAAYNASKAGLAQYGDSLRIEMRPFGVRVINVITGGTSTNIAESDKDRHIPPDSIYAPLAQDFRRSIEYTNPGGIHPSVHAEAVVKEVLKPDPRAWLWVGPMTGLVWFLSWFPRTVFDPIIAHLFNLGKLDDKGYTRQTWFDWLVVKLAMLAL